MKTLPFVILLLTLFAPNTLAECALKMRVADYKPYHYLNEAKEYVGLNIDMVNVLMNEAGCSVAYFDVPWGRALSMLENGEIDLMVNMSITEERRKYVHFIGPQMDESIILVVRNGFSHSLRTLDDLLGLNKNIGIETGLFYGSSFHEKYDNDVAFRKKWKRFMTSISILEN